MIKQGIALLTIAFICVGCNSKGTYESIQESNRIECERLPQTEYEQCMDSLKTSYEEYERERQEAMSN